MRSSLGSNDPIRRRAPHACAGLAVVALALGACAEGDPEWRELGGWQLTEVWEHADVHAYDRVAVTAGPEEVAWLTRERGGDALAVWQSDGAADVQEVTVETPDDRIVIPLGVGVADAAWVAVAATRDRPNGENTGLLAWRSSPSPAQTPAAEALRLPERGAPPPQAVNAAQAGGTAAVAGLTADGEVVIWTAEEGEDWRASVDDLGLDGDLAALDLLGVDDGFALAGVDRDGGGHVWTSSDGQTWDEVASGDPPTDVLSVTLLGTVGDGDVAIAWPARPDDGDAEVGLQDGTSVTIQRLAGTALTDEGTVEADPDEDIDLVGLTGAARGADGRIVAVGWSVRPGDDRAPAVWVGDGDRWLASPQPEFTGRLGHQLRAVARVGDGDMLSVATPSPAHIDVEVWRWSAGDPAH